MSFNKEHKIEAIGHLTSRTSSEGVEEHDIDVVLPTAVEVDQALFLLVPHDLQP